MFALAFLYQVFIFNIFMARLAVEPGPDEKTDTGRTSISIFFGVFTVHGVKS